MPRGGRRAGQPGVAYAQRTDLQGAQPVQAATGQPYGVRAQQVAAQEAIPLPQLASSVPPPRASAGTPAPAGPPSAPAGVLPGQVVPLDAPSMRPGEPVTAGLPIGAGPGPEVLGALAGMGDSVAQELRAIYARFPTEELREMIEDLDED